MRIHVSHRRLVVPHHLSVLPPPFRPYKRIPVVRFLLSSSVGALVVFGPSSADYGPLDHLPKGEHVAETAPKQVQVIVDAEAEGGQHGRDLQQPAGGKPPEEQREGIQAQRLTEMIHASAVGMKLGNLPATVANVLSDGNTMQLEAIMQFHRLLFRSMNLQHIAVNSCYYSFLLESWPF
ncbi:hypothetical protein C4D60_Mb11t22820 [Musa balbisiana]|uniref:Uncharacterized protein n=1 Tax=Musa balbisiana TaxID=52838 RepID=A0A4S8J647_MUSBA|nr:hypothetical protein C4D60_Mb11t22820 [Musa balbisiana]